MCVCVTAVSYNGSPFCSESSEKSLVLTRVCMCVCACALMYINVFIYCALVFMSTTNFQDKNVFVFVAGCSPSRENGKEPLFNQ